ncbi:MAG: hypothetical protein KKA73_30930, partial [Chloroflexi bacterium]|nr:hypothetical protein [Chloroflexota bacterium]
MEALCEKWGILHCWKLWLDLNRSRFDFFRLLQSVFKSMAYFVGVVLLGLAVWGTLQLSLASEVTDVVRDTWTQNPAAFLGGAGL